MRPDDKWSLLAARHCATSRRRVFKSLTRSVQVRTFASTLRTVPDRPCTACEHPPYSSRPTLHRAVITRFSTSRNFSQDPEANYVIARLAERACLATMFRRRHTKAGYDKPSALIYMMTSWRWSGMYVYQHKAIKINKHTNTKTLKYLLMFCWPCISV